MVHFFSQFQKQYRSKEHRLLFYNNVCPPEGAVSGLECVATPSSSEDYFTLYKQYKQLEYVNGNGFPVAFENDSIQDFYRKFLEETLDRMSRDLETANRKMLEDFIRQAPLDEELETILEVRNLRKSIEELEAEIQRYRDERQQVRAEVSTRLHQFDPLLYETKPLPENVQTEEKQKVSLADEIFFQILLSGDNGNQKVFLGSIAIEISEQGKSTISEAITKYENEQEREGALSWLIKNLSFSDRKIFLEAAFKSIPDTFFEDGANPHSEYFLQEFIQATTEEKFQEHFFTEEERVQLQKEIQRRIDSDQNITTSQEIEEIVKAVVIEHIQQKQANPTVTNPFSPEEEKIIQKKTSKNIYSQTSSIRRNRRFFFANITTPLHRRNRSKKRKFSSESTNNNQYPFAFKYTKRTSQNY
jgi:hypothetical protein